MRKLTAKGLESATSTIKWKVGILPTGECFIHFESDSQHFKCTMTEDTAIEMGKALQETGEMRKSGYKPKEDGDAIQ